MLLDTSTWIDLLRGSDNSGVRYVLQRESAEDLVITRMSYLEVLQGARSEAEMDRLGVLLKDRVVPQVPGLHVEDAAARMYLAAGRRGLTVRNAVDCLNAAMAVELDVVLVHNDRDFYVLADVESRLAIFPFAPLH